MYHSWRDSIFIMVSEWRTNGSRNTFKLALDYRVFSRYFLE
uniref:Uncharacterized protein n=1 Tax=virus sp. ctML55 TaxID=2827627 RepID=A0A8S5RI83_9VIRU|nr:MAG TPA: hypothetical protein [virus sp. ctML55]